MVGPGQRRIWGGGANARGKERYLGSKSGAADRWRWRAWKEGARKRWGTHRLCGRLCMSQQVQRHRQRRLNLGSARLVCVGALLRNVRLGQAVGVLHGARGGGTSGRGAMQPWLCALWA
jgi:hypothetical protein